MSSFLLTISRTIFFRLAYWKELGRTRFNAQPGVDPDDFERLWPRILENFFLAETTRVAKKLRFLSQGRDN